MNDKREILEIYLDTEQHKEVTSAGYDVRQKTTIYRCSQILFRAHLRMRDAATYFTPPANAAWWFGVDLSFDPAHADVMVSDNDQFNIGEDWSELNVANGKICWRASSDTTQLRDALGTAASKVGYAELWMIPVGEEPVMLVHWEVVLHNIATDLGTETDLIPRPSLLRADGNDVVLYYPDGSVAQRWSST